MALLHLKLLKQLKKQSQEKIVNRLRRVLLTLLFAILSTQTFSQESRIFWADKLEFQYNAFSPDANEYSGLATLGAPDAEAGKLSPRAFRMKTEKSYGRLVVSFDQPREISQVWIVENFLPGRITKVIIFDEDNNKYAAYDGQPQALSESSRNFVLDMGKTSYKVWKIEININTINHPGWSQIDAIGVSSISKAEAQDELQKLNQQTLRITAQTPASSNVSIDLDESKVAAEIERLARLDAEEKALREAREKAEAEERARIEAEKKAKEEAEQKAKEEAERIAKLNEEARLKEEARVREEARLREEARQRELARQRDEARILEVERQREEARIRAEREAAEKVRAEEEARLKAQAEEIRIREERAKAEAEARQKIEMERLKANSSVQVPTKTNIPQPLVKLADRYEAPTEGLSLTQLELINVRRELDVKAMEISTNTNVSFIQTTTIKDLYSKPEIPKDFRRQSVGDGINSPYAEVKPIVTSDGQRLYFSRQRFPENFGGERDEQDIYFADLIDGEWGEAQNIGEPLNNILANGIVAVTGDGNTVLLINEYNSQNKAKSGVSISTRQSDGKWSYPQTVVIEDHYNRSAYVDYFLSANGKIMILAVERRDTKGDQDLYVSFIQENGKWSVPKNMGAAINSAKAEFSPFLAADNRTLYFASEGHNSMGGPDVFVSRRLDNSWTNWSAPKNLGSTINSSGYEAYLTVPANGEYAYLVTDQGGIDNSRDIYIVAIPEEFKPDPVMTVFGRIVDANTLKPVKAKLVVESIMDAFEAAAIESDEITGEFTFLLPAKDQYQLRSLAPGYSPANEIIDLLNFSSAGTVEKTIYLKSLKETQSNQNLVLNEERRTELDRNIQKVETKATDASPLLLTFSGFIKSDKGEPLSSKFSIIFENDSSQWQLVDVGIDGKFEIEIPYGMDFNFISQMQGYFNQEGMVSYIESGPQRKVSIELIHKPIETGITESLPSISFQQGASILLDGSYPTLDSIASFLVRHPSVEILLSGHTDAIGDPQLNMKLSQDRVESVKSYFVGKGVDEDRIQTEAFGGTRPIASNASEVTRRLNRRVELTILKN
jgi:OmpA-OmpF porin, OOP family